MNESAQQLARQFQDEEFRRAYAEDFLNTALAMQIAVLRKQHAWSQQDLASRTGTTQSVISRLEDVNYGNWSVRKLKELAAAFGLTLHICFEEYGTLVDKALRFSEINLRRNSFEADGRIRALLGSGEEELSADAGAADIFAADLARTLLLEPAARASKPRRWLAGYGLPMGAAEGPPLNTCAPNTSLRCGSRTETRRPRTFSSLRAG